VSTSRRWIRSAAFDGVFFVGPAILALLLVAPALIGWLPADYDAPLWAWIALVLMVDVAHVWSSLYRVYLDREERRRRPWLYGLTPVIVYATGTLLYAVNPAWFWTALAYVAVHHFVKQQVGFVALYRGVIGERDPWVRRLDHAAVYVGTLVPVAYWHVNLPRHFQWFMEGDFLGPWPQWFMTVLWPVYVVVGLAWVGLQVRVSARRGYSNPGKLLTMAATWTMWGVGIVAMNSDYVFTATNVLLHGVPYMALVWITARPAPAGPRPNRAWVFVAVLLVLAFIEEGLWDATVWAEHAEVFGDWSTAVADAAWAPLLFVPLLTVPQATHYILDGFIWRQDGSNPGLRERLQF